MSDSHHDTATPDIDTIVDTRTAVYDQLESKPYALLQEDIADLVTETVEAAGRDGTDVREALTSDPLDEDWWFEISNRRALQAVVVAGDEGLIRIDVTYELGASRDLSVPSPDALPLLDDGAEITIYCVLDGETEPSLSYGGENLIIEGVPEDDEGTKEKSPPTKGGDDEDGDEEGGGDEAGDDGSATVSLVGPEGQSDSVSIPQDKTIGFVVTEIKTSYDVYDGEIGLYEDQSFSSEVANDADPSQFDGGTVYWQVERRAN